MRKYCAVMIFVVIRMVALGQEVVEEIPDEPAVEFSRSVKLGGGIPFISGSGPYQSVFKGTFQSHGSVDVGWKNSVFAGAYGSFTQVDNANLRLKSAVLKSQTTGVGVRFGYQRYISKSGLVSAGIEGGYSRINYKISYSTADTITQLPIYKTWEGGGFAGYSYTIEGRKAVGICLRYTLVGHQFDPSQVGQTGKRSDDPFQLISVLVQFIQGF